MLQRIREKISGWIAGVIIALVAGAFMLWGVQFYFEEKSYKEIADESGEELGMVRSNIQNGRRNLRICLEKVAPISNRKNTQAERKK